MEVFTDMIGCQLQLDHTPCRIISLVPSQTELMYDLGLDEKVVGITKFCIHPESWFRTKTRVGGTKNVNLDVVRKLKPDLIIANKEENNQEQIVQLQQEFPVWTSDIKNLDDALRMILAVGKLTGSNANALKLKMEIENGFEKLQKLPKPLKVAYCIWRDPWMWAGGDTFIADMLNRAGCINVLLKHDRYPVINLESLIDLSPELVLLSSEPYPFKEKHMAEIEAVLPNAKVMLTDGEMWSWYGSRLILASKYISNLVNQII